MLPYRLQTQYDFMENNPDVVACGGYMIAFGNCAQLLLPNKVYAYFSGLGAYYPDRTEIQRKGVIPDIEVYPDMQSILEGRDEILERAAISYINEL
jgi:hypothetical protein